MPNYLAAHWLEIAGTITTVFGIWLTTRRLLICWPVVLAADFLYLAVFFRARLFSDALLQIFFVAFTLYGWWHWWRGVRADGEVRVVPLHSARAGYLDCVVGAVGAVLSVWLMVPNRRGSAASGCGAHQLLSLVASWWGARNTCANWWLWIVVDVIYVGEYLYKELCDDCVTLRRLRRARRCLRPARLAA